MDNVILEGRTQKVVVEGASSDPSPVKSGVPQGSVLGPLLFLLFINDLAEHTSSTVRLFADDCVMYKSVKTIQDCKVLQNDLDQLHQWEKRWQLRFNARKCNIMRATHAKKKQLLYEYKLGREALLPTNSTAYLGVELSSDLKWNTHVRKTASKANQTLGVLRRNLKNCPREIKNMAYKSILRPKMEYAAPILDPYTKDNIQLLEAVQRRATRFVCNKYSRHESVTSMLQDLDWPLMEQRRAESRLTLFHRIVHKEVDINEHALMERNPRASRKVSSLDGPRLLRTVSSTPSFHIPSLSGMLYLQGMICHSSNPKSSLLTCVMAVHSTNHALTAVIMILKDRNSLHIN